MKVMTKQQRIFFTQHTLQTRVQRAVHASCYKQRQHDTVQYMLHATSHMVNAISYILRIKSSGGHALFLSCHAFAVRSNQKPSSRYFRSNHSLSCISGYRGFYTIECPLLPILKYINEELNSRGRVRRGRGDNFLPLPTKPT